MKRVLLIGNAPLPDENTKSRPAAGLRTYQFSKPLFKEGGTGITDAKHAFSSIKRQDYAVRLVGIAMPECYEKEPKQKEIRHSDKYSQLIISKDDPELFKTIQAIHDEFHPDAIIGVNTYPSYVASQLNSRAPFWADLNGWVMAEGQAQSYKLNTNNYLPHYYKMEKSILKRADKLSAVSEAQRFALLGELASSGRLNKESFGYQFVHHIPNGMEWFDGEKDDGKGDGRANDEIFKNVPENAFVLLWLGGYNTWVDEVTLFKGVEAAMGECEKLHFVSTGGEIEGLDNKTFAKFKEMIDKSEYKNRFVFLGWVDTEDIPYIYKRANCGLNVDRKCVETLTGARNRINEMMKFGLPVITTLGSEISREVERVGAGIGVKSGRHELLGEAICSIYKEWRGGNAYVSEDFKKYGKEGQKYIENECNYEKVCRPLLKWLENPRPAPNRGVKVNFGKVGSLRGGLQYFKDKGVKKGLKKVWQKGK